MVLMGKYQSGRVMIVVLMCNGVEVWSEVLGEMKCVNLSVQPRFE